MLKLFQKIKEKFKKKKLAPTLDDGIDLRVVEAMNYAKQKIDNDPRKRFMTKDEIHKELMEWSGHYLRENWKGSYKKNRGR